MSPSPAPLSSPDPVPVAAQTPARRPRRVRPARLLGLLALLALAALVALLFFPPAWQAAFRALGTEAAARRGLRLEIGETSGDPWSGMVFQRVRLSGRGTDLRADRVQVDFHAPSLPYFQRPHGSLLRRVLVTGLAGEAVLTPPAAGSDEPAFPAGWTDGWRARFPGGTAALAGNLVPAEWGILNGPADTFALVAPAAGGGVRATGLRLDTGEPGRNAGFFSVGPFEAQGPGGIAYRAAGLRGLAAWRGTWLTLQGVDLSPGVTLDALTVEAVHLVRRGRLEGEAVVRALGGELRAQGTAGPGGPDGRRPTLAVACSVTGVAVLPLADLLGVPTPVPLGGTIRAGQFSFRGDPARPAEGTGSVLAEVTDFRFGSRAWQRLRLSASVLPPRATVHELKLVQGANALDLEGEFPVAALSDPRAAGWRGSWRAGGVSGRLHARLGDLRAFAELLGPAFPPLAGRLNLRGELRGPAGGGAGEPEGSFRVEGGPVLIRETPLDRLRADVNFHHGELNVRDLQVSRGNDTLTGRGTFRVVGGPWRYAGEGRVQLRDFSLYAGALPPGMFANTPRGMLDGEWTGDGAAGSHAGTFKGRVKGLLAPKGAPLALPRAVDVDGEGTYSPESVAFRRLTVRDAADPKAEFHLQLENVALPWTQNAAAWAAEHYLQPDGTLAGWVEARELALDLVVPILPARWGIAPGTDGRVTGRLLLGGTPRVPRFTGVGQLRRGRLRWRDPARRWAEADALTAYVTLAGGDHLRVDRGAGERPVTLGGGSLTFGGRVEWTEREAPVGLDGTLQWKNGTLLDTAAVRARGDVELAVRGLANAPEISGTVRLREGGRFWPRFTFTAEPPTVPPLAAALGFPGPAGEVQAPWADASLDLHVTSTGPLMLEGPEGPRGELRPDFRVTGTGRRPELNGALTLRRVKVGLPAAEMELEDGAQVRFDPDGAPGEVLLELSARKNLPPDPPGRAGTGTRLRADFSGLGREGRVLFSAEPPVWTPSEVAAFLVGGNVPVPVTAAEPAAEPSPAPKLYLRLR